MTLTFEQLLIAPATDASSLVHFPLPFGGWSGTSTMWTSMRSELPGSPCHVPWPSGGVDCSVGMTICIGDTLGGDVACIDANMCSRRGNPTVVNRLAQYVELESHVGDFIRRGLGALRGDLVRVIDSCI